MAMNLGGQHHDPLGLNWLPMLVLYSNIGKKANSATITDELGKELKNLYGKHELVIDGISKQLDALIRQKANINLDEGDMKELKKEIVAKLGEAASASNAQSSAPVSCDHNGIVFDEDAKTVLAGVVDDSIKAFHRDNRVCDDSLKQFEGRLVDYLHHNFKNVWERLDRLGGDGPRVTYEGQEDYPPEIYHRPFEEIVEMFKKGHPVLYLSEDEDMARHARDLSHAREGRVINETITRDEILYLIRQRASSSERREWLINETQEFFNDLNIDLNSDEFKPIEILRLMYTFIVTLSL